MQNKVRHLACVLALGLFLCMALASEFLDESTNVSISQKPSDCEDRPVFTGTLKVIVECTIPASAAWRSVEVFVSNQKIDNTTDCTSFYQYQHTESMLFLFSGTQTYETPSFTHDNKADLWRVEIRSKNAGAEDWDAGEVRVLYYNQTATTFNVNALPSL